MPRIVAATDGSAINNPHGPAGWAWYVSDECWAAGGFERASNQYAELFAILAVLRAVPRPNELLVRTDSQFAINSLTKWMPGWKRNGWKKKDGQPPANLGLLKELDNALHGRVVRFEWVRGHNGDRMNERADMLCTRASRSIQTDKPVPTGPGFRAEAVSGVAVSEEVARQGKHLASPRRPERSGGIRGMIPMSPAMSEALRNTRPSPAPGSNFRSTAPARRPIRQSATPEVRVEFCAGCGGPIDPVTAECRCSD